MKELNVLTSEFLERMQSTKNLSEKTITAYRSDLKDFCVFLSFQELTEDTILKYIRHLSTDRRLKDSTINRKLIVLKMFFDFLCQQQIVEKNYVQSHWFKYKRERKLPKTLATKEVSKLLSYLEAQTKNAVSNFAVWKSARDLALIDILISTGIRIAEASNISIDDIIQTERVVLIHGKGRKQRLIYIYIMSPDVEQSDEMVKKRKKQVLNKYNYRNKL